MQVSKMVYAGFLSGILFSCVSTKKYDTLQSSYDDLNQKYLSSQKDLTSCNSSVAELTQKNASWAEQVEALNKQVAFLKENNTQGLKQLQEMSVISAQQAESIRKSMENIGAKDSYIMTLQQTIAHKDSLNMALMMNLKGAVGEMNDQDINIKVDKGIVLIDISDKLLFQSGDYTVTANAKEVLGKVAKVLKNQPDMEFAVEGNTDDRPYRRGVLLDNWDLSVKRATAVVRILQEQYGLAPSHIIAAGRSEYQPLTTNDTPDGRAINRRTRIIILPQLDQFFKLLENKG